MFYFSREDVPRGIEIRVLQSAEPKEAVVQRESLEFMSHEATEMKLAVLGTMDKVVGGERGRGLVTPGLRRAAPMGPKITGPGSSDAGAVRETRVRASPHRSPRLTWRSLDRGERRRLKLTRQNGKGNVASTCAESCSPRGGEVRAHSLKSRQGVAQDHKRAPHCRGSRTSSEEPNKLICVTRAHSIQNQPPHKTEVQTSSFCSIWFGVDLDTGR
jgi:hypothetical protein